MLNLERAEEELHLLMQVQYETNGWKTEHVDLIAKSLETLKMRTEKLKEMEEKVEKVISQLDWLVEIEDGVKDPFNNRSFVANIGFSDLERIANRKIENRLVTLTKMERDHVSMQIRALRTAKERLEKWLTLRRALKTSGGAAVESGLIRSVLSNVNQALEQLPTVKNVLECTNHFKLASFNLSSRRSSIEDMRLMMDEFMAPFAEAGFTDDEIKKLGELVVEQDAVQLIERWKVIKNLTSVAEKVDHFFSSRSLKPLVLEEAEIFRTWLKKTDLLRGYSCLIRLGKDIMKNESVLHAPFRIQVVRKFVDLLRRVDSMWLLEKRDTEPFWTRPTRYLNRDIDDTTKKFRAIASAMRAASMVIRYESEFETILNSSEILDMTVESLSAGEKARVGWTSEFPLCLVQLKTIGSKLQTHYDDLDEYNGLEKLAPLVEHMEGTYRCESTDIFARLMPHTNGPLNAALKTFENVSSDFSHIQHTALNLKEVSEVLKDIGPLFEWSRNAEDEGEEWAIDLKWICVLILGIGGVILFALVFWLGYDAFFKK